MSGDTKMWCGMLIGLVCLRQLTNEGKAGYNGGYIIPECFC